LPQFFVYSENDLGITPGVGIAPGDVLTASPTASPDMAQVQDDDPSLNAMTVSPTVTLDTNQVLAAPLVVDGVTVGNVNDIIYANHASLTFVLASGSVTTLYPMAIIDQVTGAQTFAGFAASAPIIPGASYTYTSNAPFVSTPYTALAACFTRDTMIDCENGPKAVQDIVEGDLVVTRNNGLQAVRWVGGRSVVGAGDMAPVRVKAGVLGNAVDLRFSPMHRVLICGPRAEVLFGEAEVLAHAAHLCDGDRVYREPCAEVTYFHILFDGHEIIRAHGCWSESFAPNAAGLGAVGDATRVELLKLFPQLGQDWQDALPTLTAAEARLTI
jgi:hypothetical protein